MGSLNINGARDGVKRALTLEVIKQKQLKVTFLQETHSDVQNETEWQRSWDGGCFLSHGSNISGGVAILISPGLEAGVLGKEEAVRGRMLSVRMKIRGVEYVFLNIYAPNNGAERESFFDKLNQELSKISDSGVVVVMGGDWNCTLDFSTDRNGEEPHRKSAEALSRIIARAGLCDVWREQHPAVRQYTWVKCTVGCVSAARLDRLYISKGIRNRTLKTFIYPVGFTDHHMVTLTLSVQDINRTKTYWKFNAKLVEDVDFCKRFETFWELWREERPNFDSVSLWWEVGKAQIRVFCQQYTANSTVQIRKAISVLEKEIAGIEDEMVNLKKCGLADGLKERKNCLASILNERAKGAMVRARFSSLNEMDAPSSFFFNLEKKILAQNELHSIKLSGGRVTTDPGEIRDGAAEFYRELFKAEPVNKQQISVLHSQLPTLSIEDKETLDLPINFQELTEAVYQMAPGRAPGIDGLSAEFYKKFWPCIGKDLYEVIMESVENGELPQSCRRAVLTLLPKKGDLSLIKNWRPLALLCSDFKILSKTIANRVKKFLGKIIHKDQSYCIPDRTIRDNLFLIRDVIDLAEKENLSFGIFAIDQEKAFDRVDHGYLEATLKAFGFGEGLVSWVNLLYHDVSCLVKAAGGLSRPIRVQRGIRQGCPLSGLLYTVAIEPMLCLIRHRVRGLEVPGVLSDNGQIKVSAYADDVTVILSTQEDLNALKGCIQAYEQASTARVNWEKSEGLLCGAWQGRPPPKLPGNIVWQREGLKVLGVHLGTKQYTGKNWEGALDKACARMSKWKWLLSQVSFRGRVLILNNLVASALWHKLAVLPPPKDFLRALQRNIVNFFWSGQHWLRAAVLYLPLNEGGQGLIDLESRIRTFRLQAAQRLLYSPDVSWRETACALLRRAGDLKMDLHLFLMDLQGACIAGLSDFYASMLRAWSGTFSMRRGTLWGAEEPLFHNPLLGLGEVSASLRTSFVRAGITKLVHLCTERGDWRDAVDIAAHVGVHSVRQVEVVLARVRAAVTAFAGDDSIIVTPPTTDVPGFPSIQVQAEVGEWQEEQGKLLTFGTPLLGDFKRINKRALYTVCVKVWHLPSLGDVRAGVWQGLGPEFLPHVKNWRLIYKAPVPKRSGDLQWRIIHGAIATNRHLAHLDNALGEGCPFCGQEETVLHLFSECQRLSALFVLLEEVCARLGVEFDRAVFIMGPGYNAKHKRRLTVVNFLIGQAKLGIWLTRRNKIKEGRTIDPSLVFRGLVLERLKIEYAYFNWHRNVETFESIWCVNEALCRIDYDTGYEVCF